MPFFHRIILTKFFFRNVLEQHRLADKAEVDKLLLSSWNYLKLVLIMSQDTIFKENVTIKINIINRWLEGLANSIASLKVLPASNQRWFGVVLLLLLLDFIIFYFGFGMRDDRFGWTTIVGLLGLMCGLFLFCFFLGWGVDVLIKFSFFAGLPQQTTR